MSRSRKKHPFQAICGRGSAKQDKRMAARGVRRTFKHALHQETDFDDFTPPHRLECPWNDTYSWGRDGSQLYWGLETSRGDRWYGRDPEGFERMMRK